MSSQKRFSDNFAILVDNSYLKLANFQLADFFHDCWGGPCIESNGFWIELISNQNRIESKCCCPFSIENRIESKPIRFDSPGSQCAYTYSLFAFISGLRSPARLRRRAAIDVLRLLEPRRHRRELWSSRDPRPRWRGTTRAGRGRAASRRRARRTSGTMERRPWSSWTQRSQGSRTLLAWSSTKMTWTVIPWWGFWPNYRQSP